MANNGFSSLMTLVILCFIPIHPLSMRISTQTLLTLNLRCRLVNVNIISSHFNQIEVLLDPTTHSDHGPLIRSDIGAKTVE
jgi:hypothetical protein